jgi:prepilin-type N-terminal cleavage/methylation domain-containing protein
MRQRERGFTLIELMIVIAIIAIIAAIAIPNLLAAKHSANETAAIAAMRNLCSAQAQVSVSGKIDSDRDGKGEFGTFSEMTSSVGVRANYTSGSPSTVDFATRGAQIVPPILSSSMANLNAQGYVTKAGYAFIIFLPDGALPAGFAYETGPIASLAIGGTGSIGVDASETVWCAYAHPLVRGQTGSRRFFTNQRGEIVQTSNDVRKADGVGTTIAGGDAFLSGGIITGTIAIGTRGSDGDLWKVVN